MDQRRDDVPGSLPAEEEFVSRHRVGRLATANRRGQPRVIPVCFILHGGCIYIVLDQKPKSVDVRDLKRVRDIAENPRVSFLVDDYSEVWHDLAYVQVQGAADIREPDSAEHAEVIAGLRDKYPQYRSMALEGQPCIRIVPSTVHAWAWSGWSEAPESR